MPYPLAVLLCLSPSLCWLWLVHRRDDREREPLLLVGTAFALGAAAAAAVLWLRPLLEAALQPPSPALDAFVVTALAEESLKLLVLLPLLLWHPEVDEPLDGLVYGAAVGLGFAGVENVFYCADSALPLLLQRAFTATLLHASCSAGIGFAGAVGRLGGGPRRALRLLGVALLVAVLAHGSYDLCLGGSRSRALLALLVVLPAGLLVLARNMRWARAVSPHFHPRHDAPAQDG